MVRPRAFYSDPDTAATNSFQRESADSPATLLATAIQEFDAAVQEIRDHGVKVLVVEDTAPGDKPDAIFPNNWFSTHEDGTVVLYPMATASRRLEREIPVLDSLQDVGFRIDEIVDMSFYEEEGQFLEGTGSMVLDRINRLAFAGLADRTDPVLVRTFGNELGYETYTFATADRNGQSIYHTNVMMSIGTGYAVVCLEAVKHEHERSELRSRLRQWGHQVIEITFEQMEDFAGNVIEVQNEKGEKLLLLSNSARDGLRPDQIEALIQHVELLPVDVSTIQRIGGGGIRCMVAEVFLEEVPS